MTDARPQDGDYGEYIPCEDTIASTYDPADEAEEAVLREILGE